MGTWGAKIFDNDAAADFLLDVADDGQRAVTSALKECRQLIAEDDMSEADAPWCIAASCIVATAHGAMPPENETLAEELATTGGFPRRTLAERITRKADVAEAKDVADAVLTFYQGDILRELGADEAHRDAVIANTQAVVDALGRVEGAQ